MISRKLLATKHLRVQTNACQREAKKGTLHHIHLMRDLNNVKKYGYPK